MDTIGAAGTLSMLSLTGSGDEQVLRNTLVEHTRARDLLARVFLDMRGNLAQSVVLGQLAASDPKTAGGYRSQLVALQVRLSEAAAKFRTSKAGQAVTSQQEDGSTLPAIRPSSVTATAADGNDQGTNGEAQPPSPEAKPADDSDADSEISIIASTYVDDAAAAGLPDDDDAADMSLPASAFSTDDLLQQAEVVQALGRALSTQQVADDTALKYCFAVLAHMAKPQGGLGDDMALIMSVIASILWLAVFRDGSGAASSGPTASDAADPKSRVIAYARWAKHQLQRIHDLQASITHARNKYYRAASRQTKRARTLKKLQGRLTVLDSTRHHLIEERTKLTLRIVAAEARLQETQADHADKRYGSNHARRLCEDAEDSVVKKQLAIRQLNAKIANLKKQLAQHRMAHLSQDEASGEQTRNMLASTNLSILKLEEELKTMQTRHHELLGAHVGLLQEIQKLNQARSVLEARIEDLQEQRSRIIESYTPRPAWEQIMEELPTFTDKKPSSTAVAVQALQNQIMPRLQFSGNRAADVARAQERLSFIKQEEAELMEAVQELKAKAGGMGGQIVTMEEALTSSSTAAGTVEPGGNITLVAHGLGKDVPAFLRAEGTVTIRLMRKTELDDFINDVWNRKLKDDNPDVSLAQFMLGYLKFRFGIKPLVVKWGYSFMYALQHYQSDCDVELFLLVLNGKLSERVRIAQNEMIQAFKEFVVRVDKLNSGFESGKVRKRDLAQALPQFFKRKSDMRLNELVQLIDAEATDELEIEGLFELNSKLVVALRRQHLSELKALLIGLRRALLVRDSEATGKVPVLSLPTVLQEMDPGLGAQDIRELSLTALGLSEDEEVNPLPTDMVDVEEVVARLSRVLTQCKGAYDVNAQPVLAETVSAEAAAAQHSESLTRTWADDPAKIRKHITSLRRGASSNRVDQDTGPVDISHMLGLIMATSSRRAT